MTILPVDTDVLEDVCRDIAQNNYGFIYVADQKSEIKSGYENADVGTLNAGSLGASDMRKALSSMSGDEFVDLEQLRDGVYYIDPFGVKGNMNITRELTNLFGQRLVVTGETLRSRFSLAIDDLEFFVDELTERDYLRRITAGKRDYYTIGTQLKEHADDVGLDARLEREASHGKIAHSDLESVIDVNATSDVIRYLDREGYIVDLNGEYLVQEAIDEYAEFLAGEIEEAVEAAFEESNHALPVREFEQVVENAIDSRFDVLTKAREVRSEILRETRSTLVERLELDVGTDVVTVAAPFDRLVDERARRILSEVKGEYDVFASPSEFTDRAEEQFDELQVGHDDRVNEHAREAVIDRYEAIVADEEF